MKQGAIGLAALAICCLAKSEGVLAELTPISDRELEQVQGQAMIAIDQLAGMNQQFTRITMGMDIGVQTNVDAVVLGDDGVASDLAVSQLSLGHISQDDTKIQLDGQAYAIGDIVPFEAENPYFELAEVDGEVVGLRVGFGQARGTLSGDISSLSGNLGLQLNDGAGNLSQAVLYDDSTTATNYRATHIGLADAATDCATGVQCSALSNLQTLDVGVDNGDGTVGFTDDLFLSFQKQAVDWQNLAGDQIINANPGVFVNIPTSMTLDLQTLQNGIPRARTEYIDRGMGLF
ncbi:hypothetical protein SAMN04487963_2523 [Marinobacter zhejiangensis]|uniref:Uncharacterized protein n=2 Tax=Marinobacter zhejiangensis TaxID=488535 RepID=A0A1I4QQP0_9GAMM|nr:hypothetical protein SAMN04487963_2523 [Marinobacter zhejiangensis]